MGNCCTTIEESNVAIIEKFGKFARLETAGCVFLNCCCGEAVSGKVSLRVQQLVVKVETKTKDNVFVYITVAVQYNVMKDKVYEAYYKLSQPHAQIEAHVSASIRARAPKIPLDALFEIKEDLARGVAEELEKSMSTCGFAILDVLITDIDPDASVKHAMNEINSSERLRVAALAKAEAAKILKVKEAEADAESRHLAGKGIALARQEIVKGLEESVSAFTTHVAGTNPSDIMRLILTTQYFDTMKEIGANSRSNIVYIPHSSNPSIGDRLQESMIVGASGPHGMTMP